ncbi:hypothetical protein EMPS_01040 [Entomortierella parvispora]|uniref:Uncharacterized protein n=1 Tax=Entomortierella parvispora TaxID=205924 RepID=A0A9P3LSA8_9FUNG|nr:hypothetical protein EMPS_01040 [Entomortierella parvispora]
MQQQPPQNSNAMARSSSASVSGTGPASASQGSFSQHHMTTTSAGSSTGPAGSGGYYIPPASDLTTSNHDKALGVIDTAFEQTDRMLDQRDMKAFGDNSESIFQELIKIRKKQLALAAKHIGIETIADEDKSLAPDGKLLDAADKDEIDPLQFARKGQELQDLMASLEDLGRSMSDFHELSNSLNKQPFSASYLSGSSRK